MSRRGRRRERMPRLGWPELIAITEEKIARLELKRVQLTALLATFRRQQKAGDPTPFDIAAWEKIRRKDLEAL